MIKRLLFLMLIIGPGACFSQSAYDSAQVYVVTRHDGVAYTGRILRDDGREILLSTTTIGKIYILKSDILSITRLEEPVITASGSYRGTGPFTTRYGFTTNALPIKKGDDYAMINFYGPEVHFAVANNLNIGLMTTWFASPLVLAGKYSIPLWSEKVHLSLGTLIGSSGYINLFRGYGGLHFGNLTIGDRLKNVTLAGGYGYVMRGDYSSWLAPGTYYSTNGYLQGVEYDRVLNPIIKGPVLSLGGIAPFASNASFIFDSMLGHFTTTTNITETTTLTAGGYDSSGNYVQPSYRYDVQNIRSEYLAFYITTGIRIQTKENRAFQFSISGVTLFEKTSGQFRHRFSIPIPQGAWFFKF